MIEDAMQHRRFHVSDERRQRLRDDRLWTREDQRARFFNQKSLHCSYSRCRGRRRWLLATVRDHLIRNGRHPDFQVWRGPGEWDSSDEEWEEDFWTPIVQPIEDVDPFVDTRRMVEDAFRHEDEAPRLEGRVQDIVLDTFTVADECTHNVSGMTMPATA
jgi:hypothetical protein